MILCMLLLMMKIGLYHLIILIIMKLLQKQLKQKIYLNY